MEDIWSPFYTAWCYIKVIKLLVFNNFSGWTATTSSARWHPSAATRSQDREESWDRTLWRLTQRSRTSSPWLDPRTARMDGEQSGTFIKLFQWCTYTWYYYFTYLQVYVKLIECFSVYIKIWTLDCLYDEVFGILCVAYAEIYMFWWCMS